MADDTREERKAKHLRLVGAGSTEARPHAAKQGADGQVNGEGRSGGRAPSGLTWKQERFAMELADGKCASEAYRAAYDAGNMKPATINEEASRLAARPEISARADALLAEKRAKALHVEARAEDRIWRGIWQLAEGDDTPPAVKATALGLAAKLAGMMTDKVEVSTPAAAQDIEKELLLRLQRYK